MILQDPNRVIADGVARTPDLFAVSLVDVRDRFSSPDACFLAVWRDGGWRSGVSVPWKIVGMDTLGDPPDRFVLLGEEGDVWLLGGGQQEVEKIDRESGLPLTGIGTVAGEAFAVGMGRQVYLRERAKVWTPKHGRMLSDRPPDVVGINTIVGSGSDRVFAAGWGGEIWISNGIVWEKEDSPTNHIISDGVIADDGRVFFCGRHGTIISGDKGLWQIIEIDETDDFWSSAIYRGDLYFSSQTRLYRLVDGEIEAVSPEVDGFRGTYYRLQVVDGLLFSFGERDILIFDGDSWSRVPTE